TTGTVRTGLWAHGFQANGETSRTWPILEYNHAINDFQAWDGAAWQQLGLPADADTDSWYTLSIKLNSDNVVFNVSGTRGGGTAFAVSHTDTTIDNTTTFRWASLNSRNGNDSTYNAYWDNLTSNAGASGSSVWTSASLNEGGSAAITGLEVADRDGDTLTTVLNCSSGTMSVTTGGGATITGNDSGTVTVQGTASQINAAIAGLTFTGNAGVTGSTSIAVTTTDSGGLSDTDTISLSITGSAVADTPANNPPQPAPTPGPTAPPAPPGADAPGSDTADPVTIVRETPPADTGNDPVGGTPTPSAAPGPSAPVGDGFQVSRIGPGIGGTDDGATLVVVRPVTESVMTQGTINFTLPTDTFAAQGDALVQLTATQADGQTLPAWLAFDPQTGSFVGTPPPGTEGEIVILVVARDQSGQVATAQIRFNIETSAIQQPASPPLPGTEPDGGQGNGSREPAPNDQDPGQQSGLPDGDAEIIRVGGQDRLVTEEVVGKTAFTLELQKARMSANQGALLAAAREVARYS
ncbi:MAG: putative Ig domain-containing protein, partial [Rhodospirillales bacterium]|nr:putative Ig domain-containing protein [Rhodospirillales bacterium]